MRKCSSTILYAACTFRPYKSTPVLKLFRTFTGKMTRGLSLRMVFSLLFQDTLLVAVAAKADGRGMPSAVLTPQPSFAIGARSSKHRSQHVGSEETKYDEFFRSPLRHYQSAVLDVSFCSTQFPSTRVRIPGVLEGDNIEHQLTIDSATDIPCI